MSDERKFSINQDICYSNILTYNPYKLVSNAYNGDGIIADGSALVPYSRESFYSERKATSYYRNFIKPIVDAMIVPVFDAPVTRETSSDLFELFLEDVDNKGTDITENSLNVATLSRLHGVTFVIMDNFSLNEIPSTVNDVISQRKIPYIYTQPAYNVKKFTIDDFGRFVTITFYNNDIELEGKKYRVTTTWTSMEMIKEIWDGTTLYKTFKYSHNLGVIPVIPVYSTNKDVVLPVPPVYDLAKMNVALYNKDSELRDQERAQAFSVFYAQFDTNNSNVSVGPHSMMVLPLDPSLNISPGYASPDSAILQHLMNSSKDLVESIYQCAGQAGVVGVKSNSSGIAEAYKFKSSNNQLKRTATIAENYEKALANLFSLYIKQPVEYSVSYTSNFDTFYNQITIADYDKILKMGLPDKVLSEFKKVMVRTYLDNLDMDKLGELNKVIDEEEGDEERKGMAKDIMSKLPNTEDNMDEKLGNKGLENVDEDEMNGEVTKDE